MITTYTPAAEYHCRACDDLFIEPKSTLRRGQKLSDNGSFYRVEACPSCNSEDVETAFEYRMKRAEQLQVKE